MKAEMLGKLYRDGEVIVQQGEVGNCMYVILEGKVEVVVDNQGRNVRVATRAEPEFFGEMAIFEKQVRSATVRALGDARILTIDKRNLLRAIGEDPSMAFQLIQGMAHRIRNLTNEVVQLRLKDRREHQRMTIATNVWLNKKEEQATLQTLRNISNSGGLIESRDQLKGGQIVRVGIPGTQEEIEAKVIRTTPASYHYALQFSAPISNWEGVLRTLGVQPNP